MTQQERSGLNEAAEISAHTAGAVRGAIKTGKAVSGAAKGTAAAGPYGAAAAILWTHRKAAAATIWIRSILNGLSKSTVAVQDFCNRHFYFENSYISS